MYFLFDSGLLGIVFNLRKWSETGRNKYRPLLQFFVQSMHMVKALHLSDLRCLLQTGTCLLHVAQSYLKCNLSGRVCLPPNEQGKQQNHEK